MLVLKLAAKQAATVLPVSYDHYVKRAKLTD